jgi:dCTP deaminase
MYSTTPWIDNRWLPGVLNFRQLDVLRKSRLILNSKGRIDPDSSALDLHLSDKGYEMRKGSIKPFEMRNYSEIINDPNYAKPLLIPKSKEFLLKKSHCYVFELKEKLHVSILKDSPFYGQATAKSSIGRIDVIARLIVDGMNEYETFSPGKVTTGDLFLEITPITFNVKVKDGISLSQLRFCNGDFDSSTIKDKRFIASVLNLPLDPENSGTLAVDISNQKVSNSLMIAAYSAKNRVSNPIELWGEEKYDLSKFWSAESSYEQENLKSITIKRNKFYILRSLERISLPAGVCIYCRAMDETLGEMRIHYAGFVHPLFGTDRADGRKGTPLIFEVRGHNVNVMLTQNEILARLFFYRMSDLASKPKAKSKKQKPKPVAYNEQELNLSKFFKKPLKK